MSKEIDDKCIFEFKEICDKLGIKCFLLLGTCLGFYRDKDYCEDYMEGEFPDVDVGVICSKEELIILFKTLQDNGFTPGPYFRNPGWELNHHFYKHDVLLDIYFQFLEDVEPLLENLESIDYKGVLFSVPSPVEEYLELEYGKTWKIPSDERSRPLKPDRTEKLGWIKDVSNLSKEQFTDYMNSKERFRGNIL